MVNKGQRRAHVRSTMQQYAPLHHPINYSLSTTPSAAVDIIHMLKKISRAAESLGIEQRGGKKTKKTTTVLSCWNLAVKVSAENPGHQGYLGNHGDCGRELVIYEDYKEKVGSRAMPPPPPLEVAS